MNGWVKVEGESMRPFLSPGDAIRVHWDSEGEAPVAGELVLARGRSADELVVHRVIRSRPLGVVTKGDFSFRSETVDSGAVWGRVTGVRFARTGAERDLNPNRLDRAIAFLSGLSEGTSGLGRRMGRKLTYLLAALRRELL